MSVYCDSRVHSRPPTKDEFTEDYARRVEALEQAEERGIYSAAQLEKAREILETFTGYRRCTLEPES